jgi:MFS family permease
MISRLIREVGHGWAMRIAAFLILFLLLIANLTVKARNPPNPQNPTKEELLSPLKEPVFLLVVAGGLFLTFGIFIPITYLVVSAIASSMSTNLSQYLLPILNAASLFGRLSCGFLAVKIGSFNVLISACHLCGILTLGLWITASSNAEIIVYAVLFGFTSGAYVSLLPALVSQTSPAKQVGFRTGLLFLFSSPGALMTGPIAGAILASDRGDFLGMKIFAGVFILVGTTLILGARLHATGLKLNSKF